MRRRAWSRDRRGEAGESLVEVVVSTAILGIVGVGIIGAIATVLISTDVDRRVSAGETVLRSYVAAIQDAPYADCAAPGDYGTDFAAPERFTASVTAITYWQAPDATTPITLPPSTVALAFGPGCVVDPGLQRIEVKVESSGARTSTERVTFFKRRVGP
jgi:hypothetical protein